MKKKAGFFTLLLIICAFFSNTSWADCHKQTNLNVMKDAIQILPQMVIIPTSKGSAILQSLYSDKALERYSLDHLYAHKGGGCSSCNRSDRRDRSDRC